MNTGCEILIRVHDKLCFQKNRATKMYVDIEGDDFARH